MKNFAEKRSQFKDPVEYEQSVRDRGCTGFCPVPWTAIGVNNNGDYRMCVQAAAKQPERGIIAGMRVETHTIDQARNSDLMREVRRDMIAGKRSEHCARCNREDDSGFSSRRWLDLKRWWMDFDINDAIANTADDGTIDTEHFPLLDIDLRMDNTCNLKCRMCGPTESHQWYTEWMKTTGYSGFKSYGNRVALKMEGNRAVVDGHNPYQWSERVDMAEMLQNDAPELKIIYMSGGEPLIIDQQYEVVQRYIDAGTAGDLELSYNTNFTNIPQRAIEQWKHFKVVHVGGSVDAVGKLNDYIRHPSKWKQIEKNIQKLDNETTDNVACWITYTWQILNATSVTDLIEWCLQQDFRKFNRYSKHPFFTYHPVHNPVHYCVTTLPPSAKQYVTEHITNWMNGWFRDWCDQQPSDYLLSNSEFGNIITEWDHGIENLYTVTCDQLNSMLNFMNSRDTTDALPEFWRITKILDSSRNESYEELCPEIAGHIKQHLGTQ